ncbi:unnamed protein product [Discula destructiva]
MAPITIASRVPATLVLLAPRDSQSLPNTASSLSRATIARRFHAASLPAIASRTFSSGVLDAPSPAHLHARQATDTVPGQYPLLNAGPDPGTVVGIVLGSVGGFLLLLWLIYTCFQIGGRGDTVSSYGTASVVTRKSRRRHSRHHHRSPAHRETVEIRTARPVTPREAETVVVEERTERRMSQPPPPPQPRPPMAAPPPPRIVTDDEDEVVVIEEHTPPRRVSQHKSKRQSRRRSSSASRRESGFREVDPDRFAGGNASFREVRRGSRR